MKKTWEKPSVSTISVDGLETHIKVASWSGCEFRVFR